jgi:alpha-1,2-glucosyltransferase
MRPVSGCDTASLRLLNVGATCLICLLSYRILRMIRKQPVLAQNVSQDIEVHKNDQASDDPTMIMDANTALNITLFPPLFFFSALFYTDVMSTLLVLLGYSVLLRKRTVSGSLFENSSAILVGVVALLFRQTNIFWVAVFPAGLAVIDALKTSAPPSDNRKAKTIAETIQSSWNDGTIHDCAVQDAGIPGTRNSVHRHSNVCTNYRQTTCCYFLQ